MGIGRIAAALVCALLLASTAAAQDAFPDVTPDHWAGDAVARLADLGIVMGFPDGTFRGNEGFTRYEAALVVDRLLRVVGDEITAVETALADDIRALGSALTAMASEASTLRREVAANRAALESLWAEVASLREEMGLPPPPPLARLPEDESMTDDPLGAVEPVAPREPGDDAAAERGDPAQAEEPASPAAPTEADEPGAPQEELSPPDGEDPQEDPLDEDPLDDEPMADESVDGEPADDVLPVEDTAEAAPLAQLRPRVHVGLGVGTTTPAGVLLRSFVGLDDLFAERFGARLTLDVGRRSARPLGSLALLAHATYRVYDAAPYTAYAGAGMGYRFAGEGALASALAGGTWRAFEPMDLFAEATLDVYLQRALPTGAPRFAPAIVVGARWNF